MVSANHASRNRSQIDIGISSTALYHLNDHSVNSILRQGNTTFSTHWEFHLGSHLFCVGEEGQDKHRLRRVSYFCEGDKGVQITRARARLSAHVGRVKRRVSSASRVSACNLASRLSLVEMTDCSQSNE